MSEDLAPAVAAPPAPDLQVALVVTFAEVGRDDVLTVGGKGASLGELTKAGIRVPPGYVVTTHAFDAARREVDPTGAWASAIAGLDGTDVAAATELGNDLRAQIEQEPMPDDIVRQITTAYEELCDDEGQAELPVAVRSSATSEDSADASFAGQQDTFLWVRGTSAVIEAVRRCWGSLYSVDSIMYRRRHGLPEDGLAMAVAVQRMVDARSSGVMFTRSPLTGDRSIVAIDASWGLGSAVVGGEVTPDNFTVSKVTGEVTHRAVSSKHVRHVPAPEGAGVIGEPVPTDLREVPAVDDDELHELVDIAKRVERHYGVPQDIEWAIESGAGIFLLQARPETVWSGEDQHGPVAAPAAKAFHHVLAKFSGGGAMAGPPADGAGSTGGARG